MVFHKACPPSVKAGFRYILHYKPVLIIFHRFFINETHNSNKILQNLIGNKTIFIILIQKWTSPLACLSEQFFYAGYRFIYPRNLLFLSFYPSIFLSSCNKAPYSAFRSSNIIFHTKQQIILENTKKISYL